MSKVYAVADRYVEDFARLHPVAATHAGIGGYDDRMTDFSPEGEEARNELAVRTMAALRAAPIESERDRIARDSMIDELTVQTDHHAAGGHQHDLNVIWSPFQSIRLVFDLMPRATERDWRAIATRMNLVESALAGYLETLKSGLASGRTAAQRQARECASQAAIWSGGREAVSYFQGILDEYRRSSVRSRSLELELARGVKSANTAYDEAGRYLAHEYLPRATSRDAVGRDRYALRARAFCGMEIDLEDTYEWGWNEVRRIGREMEQTAGRILPGKSLTEVKEFLNTDPARLVDGVDRFRGWMQELVDRTTAELDGVHFDIPDRVKKIEAMIAPPGGALAMYYTGPSEDFSRPGRMWWPVDGKTRFPLWEEITTVYHEGVPGHHFQVGYTVHLADRLSRFQRMLGGTSGHSEGWALYSERLMAELGYLENPDYYLGMLAAQALRSVRVVVDIGMHLELAIPRDSDFHPGERWTPELGYQFAVEKSHAPPRFLRSEVDRYLGWPGQAISYKVGERVWMAARASARSRHGASFDLKRFHTRALELGPMGLAQLEREVSRI
ncbi:MAG: DUF885 domain-containing protein [SAR202 cluster bacterium]|nr:DUF885 domain-containing protein [SAR202 cluster bacterium]